MATNTFTEGVRPGGLTTAAETRILLCYMLQQAAAPLTREALEDVLLGEELANYFVMAEALGQLESQQLVSKTAGAYRLTQAGLAVAANLADEVPRVVRDTAVRGVIRLRQLAAKAQEHHSQIKNTKAGRVVECAIGDASEALFAMQLYMPDDLTANAARDLFIQHGDEVYRLVLAALTRNTEMAEDALKKLDG